MSAWLPSGAITCTLPVTGVTPSVKVSTTWLGAWATTLPWPGLLPTRAACAAAGVAGIAINPHARALDADRQPIKGLYAVGNDAASFTGGHYIGAGITLGPALTFGYLAAHHAADRAVAASQPAAKAGAVPRGAMA